MTTGLHDILTHPDNPLSVDSAGQSNDAVPDFVERQRNLVGCDDEVVSAQLGTECVLDSGDTLGEVVGTTACGV